LEVYYDPQFYDLELLIVSDDAGEVHSRIYKAKSSIDISKYKGAKRIQLELEPGDYTFEIVAKLPGATRETRRLNLSYYEFQLFLVHAPSLPSRAIRPSSLNYLGLLGVQGENFGQLVHIVNDVVLDAREHMDLEFTLAGPQTTEGKVPVIDVQVVDINGQGDQLDISMTELPKAEAEDGNGQKAGTKHDKRPQSSRYHDGWEDGVAYESL